MTYRGQIFTIRLSYSSCNIQVKQFIKSYQLKSVLHSFQKKALIKCSQTKVCQQLKVSILFLFTKLLMKSLWLTLLPYYITFSL